jgi:hypothetical protein
MTVDDETMTALCRRLDSTIETPHGRSVDCAAGLLLDNRNATRTTKDKE